MLTQAIALAAALAGETCTLRGQPVIETPDGRFRVTDLVEPGCAAADKADDLIVAALPRNARTRRVTPNALTELLRRRLPAMDVNVGAASGAHIDLRRAGSFANPAQTCHELATAVAVGEALSARDIAVSPCDDARTALPLTYDRVHGILRANASAPRGAYLGPISVAAAEIIEARVPVRLLVAVGPVVVTREVVTAQPTIAGDPLFVRDSDGHVFSAPSAASDVRP